MVIYRENRTFFFIEVDVLLLVSKYLYSATIGVLHGRHARLHRAGSVPTEGLLEGVRLVVGRVHSIRDVGRVPAVLRRSPDRDVPQGDELARDLVIP